MISSTIFEITFYLYALALIVNVFALVRKSKNVERVSFWLFVLGFGAHTVALLVRWGEAGYVEVDQFQKAESRVLQGWEWFEVWISHPPWSNLFESLVSFGWGMTAVSLYGMRKFNIRILSLFAIVLSIIVMGAASLLIDQSISPLIPALQSRWIHLHVTMATISYPAFGLAAILGLFYLMKTGVKNESFAVAIALSAAVVVLMVGGTELIDAGQYAMVLLGEHAGQMHKVTYGATAADGQTLVANELLRVPVTAAGLLMVISAFLFVSGGLFYFMANKMAAKQRATLLNLLLSGGFVFLSLTLLDIIIHVAFSGPIEIDKADLLSMVAPQFLDAQGKTLVADVSLHAKGPFALSLAGNPFEFMLLVTVWLGVAFYFLLVTKRDWLTTQLPSAERLDELSYKTILFAFPFLTMLIITGAIWAYYAWGRYWGWDPKETWSLVTWIVYSIYLHVRVTHGWEGKFPAIIAVVGFAVVIFTYLGVNILLSGLHSYAAG